MKGRRRQRGLAALDLLEEAVHLVRNAPPVALCWYFLGAMPFVVTLLYFWTDMSWSADARRDCAGEALLVAVAFIWMKFCQAMFAKKLRTQLRLETASQMTFRAWLRLLMQQAIIQPSKLFLLPLALVATIPFGWTFAFYENVTAFGEAKNLRTLWSRSWKQAKLWPAQNHLALSIFILLWGVMFVNILLIVLAVPHLVKMFTGVENVFTISGLHVFNSTILGVIASVTYLCCDPLLKAIYALRCFYGESLRSGEDLQVELRRLRTNTAAVAAALFVFAGTISITSATPINPPPTALNSQELDRSIVETIARPEFSWRMPRENAEETKDKSPNALDRFLRRTGHTIAKWWREMCRWLERLMPKQTINQPVSNAGGGIVSREILEICLVVLCAVLVVFLGMKVRDRIRQSRSLPRPSVSPRQVDLAEESVTADQLPEDEWLRLAREMMSKGEWRLALRALFLAGLAHLSHRGVIVLARHKSNRDYQLELRRRAPAESALQTAFSQNLRVVERTWYGRHEVNSEIVESFQDNLGTIRAI